MADILHKVKDALGITGCYQNSTLEVYIKEVINYMVDAGVPEVVAKADVSAGVISRGVSDLWNYGANTGKLSDYFYQRVTQLAYAVKSGRIITFSEGDYGMSFPVYVANLEIGRTDKLIFTTSSGLVKEFANIVDNCILLTIEKADTAYFNAGSYKWQLKLQKKEALVTVISDGLIVVN